MFQQQSRPAAPVYLVQPMPEAIAIAVEQLAAREYVFFSAHIPAAPCRLWDVVDTALSAVQYSDSIPHTFRKAKITPERYLIWLLRQAKIAIVALYKPYAPDGFDYATRTHLMLLK